MVKVSLTTGQATLVNQGLTNTPHPCILEKEQEKPTWVDSSHTDKDEKHAKNQRAQETEKRMKLAIKCQLKHNCPLCCLTNEY
jgi:hypothetical protein